MTQHFDSHPRWRLGNNQNVRSSALVVSRWLWPGNKTVLEVASMVGTWWTVAFLQSVCMHYVLYVNIASPLAMWRRASSPVAIIWAFSLSYGCIVFFMCTTECEKICDIMFQQRSAILTISVSVPTSALLLHICNHIHACRKVTCAFI